MLCKHEELNSDIKDTQHNTMAVTKSPLATPGLWGRGHHVSGWDLGVAGFAGPEKTLSQGNMMKNDRVKTLDIFLWIPYTACMPVHTKAKKWINKHLLCHAFLLWEHLSANVVAQSNINLLQRNSHTKQTWNCHGEMTSIYMHWLLFLKTWDQVPVPTHNHL